MPVYEISYKGMIGRYKIKDMSYIKRLTIKKETEIDRQREREKEREIGREGEREGEIEIERV